MCNVFSFRQNKLIFCQRNEMWEQFLTLQQQRHSLPASGWSRQTHPAGKKRRTSDKALSVPQTKFQTVTTGKHNHQHTQVKVISPAEKGRFQLICKAESRHAKTFSTTSSAVIWFLNDGWQKLNIYKKPSLLKN